MACFESISCLLFLVNILNIGPEMIKSEDTGGLVFSSLLPTLVAVFLFAAIFTSINGVWSIRITWTHL